MARGAQFRIAGIPVRVEPTFLVVIGILGYASQPVDRSFQWSILISWVVVAFISILLHELGHAVMFRHYGIRPSISIQGFGGLTSGSGELTPGQHVLVSLAGPLAALVLIGLPAAWIWQAGSVTSDVGKEVLYQVLWINIGWSVLNLLPILPLDGGNVAMSLLDLATKGRGRRPAEILSIVVAGSLALVALASGPTYIFIAMFMGIFAFMNIGSLSRVKQQQMGDELVYAQRALVEHRPADAEQVAHAVLARRPSGPALRTASELLGWARLWQGDQAGAEAAVTRYAHAGAPTAAFRAAEALAAGRLVEGVSVMTWSFANERAGTFQLFGAIAVAGTGQTRPFTTELLRLDGLGGVQAAVRFRQMLEHAGYNREAEVVASMLGADGRAAQLAPG
jgi:Zn-dependent protease